MADKPRVLPDIYAVDTSANYQIGGYTGDENTYQYTRKFSEMFTGDAAFDTSIMLASNLDCDLFTFMLNDHYEFRMLIKDSEASDPNYRKMVADSAFEGYKPCKLLGSVLIRSDDSWSNWNVYNLTTNTVLVGTGSLANARFCLGNKVHGFNKLLLAANSISVEKIPPVQTTGGNNRYLNNSYENITNLEGIEDRVMNQCAFDIKHIEKNASSTTALTFNGDKRPMLAFVVEFEGDILFFNASTITSRGTGGLTTQYQNGLPQVYALGRMMDTPNWVQMSTDVSKPQWVTRPEKGVPNDAGMVCEIYTSSSRWYVYGKHVYNGALVRRLLTLSGMYFTWDSKYMGSWSSLDDYNANLCLGTRDQYGLIKQDGYLKGFDEIKEKDPYSDLDYSKIPIVNNNPPAPDAPEADNFPKLGLDTMGATGLANGVSWFVMDDADMLRLSKLGIFYTEGYEIPWMVIAKANAVAKAAEDSLISIIQFPYDIAKMHSGEGRHGPIHVYIPGVFNSDSEWFGAEYCATGATGGYITDLNRIINAGSVLIPPRRGAEPTFLDFEPYTSLQMYVPFAGWVSLPCSQCMNNTVALQYVIDPPTGSGRAYISVSGCVIKDIPFTIGTPVPTSIHQTGPLMSTLMNTAFSVAGTVAGAAMAAETGGLSMAVGTSMAVGAVANLSNTLMDSCVPKTHTVGTNGTAITSFPTPKQPVILINRPRVKIPANMGHRYGYACDKEDVLSNLSGMTVCANVDTSGINATAGEKARLKAILESGFYA